MLKFCKYQRRLYIFFKETRRSFEKLALKNLAIFHSHLQFITSETVYYVRDSSLLRQRQLFVWLLSKSEFLIIDWLLIFLFCSSRFSASDFSVFRESDVFKTCFLNSEYLLLSRMDLYSHELFFSGIKSCHHVNCSKLRFWNIHV